MQNFKGYECSSRALPVEVRAIEPDLVFYKKKSRGKGKMGRERTQACDLERVSSLLVTTLIVWKGSVEAFGQQKPLTGKVDEALSPKPDFML